MNIGNGLIDDVFHDRQKVLLLGSKGMLGKAIKKELSNNRYHVIGVDRVNSEYCFDLLDDNKLSECFANVKPDIVINTAAVINLDLCEENKEMAYLLNGREPGIIAELCKNYGAFFVQISTDHFYNGDGKKKHRETDLITCVNEYGRTKYIGECLALTYPETLVLRTNIVGFRGKKGQPTFIEWAIHEIESDNSMHLFDDFYTSSIHTVDFAKILIKLLDIRPVGIYNLASSSVTSKKEFICRLAMELFGHLPIYEIDSVNSLGGVRRGDSLGLDTTKIEDLLGVQMPDLAQTILSIKQEYENMTLEV